MHKDVQIWKIIEQEGIRQQNNIELIASENFVSQEVIDAQGTLLTNKYAEGYPGRRYYGGCEFVDQVEQLAIDRVKELFQAEHANVQPHSGSQANMAVYMTVLQPGDRVLGMDLNHGGHLTHGHPLNFSGMLYDFHAYGVDQGTEQIDYDEVLKIAKTVKPKLIVAGASAYARTIDFSRFREIADEVGALLMVDMAHIAGLVAAGLHPTPIPYADFVTTTTHKTLRGPRGGVIMCKEKFAKALDRTVFPGDQGGPLMHVIAAKAVAFYEALQPTFKLYQANVIRNAKQMAETFQENGINVISGGTDNHLLLIDVKSSFNMTGKEAELILDEVAITVNKNTIPFDSEPPMKASGIRIGTAAMTTRGFKQEDFATVARLICRVLQNAEKSDVLEQVKKEVQELTQKYPMYGEH